MERQELDTVIYEKDGPIARIILNRPERANAQNSKMVWDVDNCLADAERDYAIKVLILKANGKGFCAGHDVMPSPDEDPLPEFTAAREAGHPWKGQSDLFTWPVLRLWEFAKPSIAQVHGYAIGGGTYFALLPDVVVASEDAYFQMPLPQGFALPGGETPIEPWVMMNFHRAYEYLYLSQTLTAAEALQFGMVNRVVPREELEETVEVMARQIAQAPLSTLMGVKSLVRRAWEGMGMRLHLQQGVEMVELIAHSADVAAWRKDVMEKGQGPGPRQVVQQRLDAAEAEVKAKAGGSHE